MGKAPPPHDGDSLNEDGLDVDGIEEVRLRAQSALADTARDVMLGMVARGRSQSEFRMRPVRPCCALPWC
jgi:hypothetical protein